MNLKLNVVTRDFEYNDFSCISLEDFGKIKSGLTMFLCKCYQDVHGADALTTVVILNMERVAAERVDALFATLNPKEIQ